MARSDQGRRFLDSASLPRRFINGHAKANRLKPSGIASKESALRCHLVPVLGSKTLDAITTEDVQRLKQRLEKKSPKTVNNILSVLSMLLKTAVAWDVIDRMPCTIRLLPIPKIEAAFHDFDEYERLVGAAEAIDAQAHLIVLLGGDAGLRCGEMMALEWTDVDLTTRRLRRQRQLCCAGLYVSPNGALDCAFAAPVGGVDQSNLGKAAAPVGRSRVESATVDGDFTEIIHEAGRAPWWHRKRQPRTERTNETDSREAVCRG